MEKKVISYDAGFPLLIHVVPLTVTIIVKFMEEGKEIESHTINIPSRIPNSKLIKTIKEKTNKHHIVLHE